MSDPRISIPQAHDGAPVGDLQPCLIKSAFAALRDWDGLMQTYAVFGQRFDVIAHVDGHIYGVLYSVLSQSTRIDYVGYLPADTALEEAVSDLAATHYISALSGPIFSQADIKSAVLGCLPRHSALCGTVSGDFLKVSLQGQNQGQNQGYIHLRHLRADGAPFSPDFVEAAREYLGQPYLWGGVGPQGLDCSGLVQNALASIGQDCPRDADQQEAALGQKVSFEQSARGDLLFWPGHVAILIEDDKILHANAYHMYVAIEPAHEAIDRIGVPRSIAAYRPLSFKSVRVNGRACPSFGSVIVSSAGTSIGACPFCCYRLAWRVPAAAMGCAIGAEAARRKYSMTAARSASFLRPIKPIFVPGAKSLGFSKTRPNLQRSNFPANL